MKDLDFDELDKAVNSLMAGVPKTPVASDQPPEKSLDIDISSSGKNLVLGDGSNGANKITPTILAPSVSVTNRRNTSSEMSAPRRGGRFMDVVHPSSDMKKPEPTRPVSREGVIVEPKNDLLTAKSEPTLLSAVSLGIPLPPVSTPESQTTPSTTQNDWPDPLEVAGFSETRRSEAADKILPMQEPTSTSRSAKQLSNSAELPLTSPFLSDTKVEKRPLGANILPAEDEQSKVPEASPSEEANDDQLPATIEDTKPLLPAELHGDLMAIESDAREPSEVPVPVQADASSPTVEVNDQSQQYDEDKKEVEGAEVPTEPSKTEHPVPIPTGPVSIPQQYKEEPSSGEPKSGAIYDTDSYHQPLAHPAKQKSGWLWIVWIILILLLGAGVGAALYFFGLV